MSDIFDQFRDDIAEAASHDEPADSTKNARIPAVEDPACGDIKGVKARMYEEALVTGKMPPLPQTSQEVESYLSTPSLLRDTPVAPTRAAIPADMVDYLITLISPPAPHPKALFLGEIEGVDFDKVKAIPDATLTGIIVRGTATPEQAEEFLRVLRPGAHFILIAPDDQPTGHVGACNIEDAGFEIRDSILWVREPGRFHYVPKASRAEREAGCEVLPARSGAEAVGRKEGSAGAAHPRAGAGGQVGVVRNHHPCLHPDALVFTKVGWMPIHKVKPGMPVYGEDGYFHEVEDVSHHPYHHPHLFRIHVSGVNETTLASNNHPFLVRDGDRKVWREAAELKVGDHLLTPMPKQAAGVMHLPDRFGEENWEHGLHELECGAPHSMINIDGVEYMSRPINYIDHVPYTGDVWNLTVEGTHTFQTAVGMSHNTVKPKTIMERILQTVPRIPGKPVIDPFHGSGTTGLAAIETGHDFIGIDREPEYVQIATARAHHWKQQLLAGVKGNAILNERGDIQIESDATLPEPEPEESVDFMDW